MEKQSKLCPTCQKSEPEVQFYRKTVVCKECINEAARVRRKDEANLTLDEKVEIHRQRKLLHAELKKIAREERTQAKIRKRRAEKQKAIAAVLPKEKPKLDVDPATKILAQRTLERRRLIEFVQAFHPKYIPGWVHYKICEALERFVEAIARGESPRMMILMPPRHGKSEIASKLFPAFCLGHHPDFEFIACSYNIALARDFSSKVREVLRSDKYAVLFPETKLDPDDQGLEAWKLLPTKENSVINGGYVAAGIGGPINGKGAHILVIDDPIKNEEEASSKEGLEKLKRWYDSTAYTRLAPNSGVLIIQTCWSDMDLAGRLEEEMKQDPDADQFEILRFPAIATEEEELRIVGDALHPERWPLKRLEQIRRTLGGDRGRFWNALYQQNPIPAEGAMFTKDMFVWRDERPTLEACHIYQAWDFAIGEKRVNDYTVGVTVAVDFEDNAHVVEVVRFRSSDQLRIANEMLDAYERHPNVLVLGVEDGQIWRGVKTHLLKRMSERRLNPTLEELRPLTDKMVRAQPLQGRMQQRKVTFPKSGDWVAELVKEFLRFPAGMHDDMVDALAWCMRIVLSRQPPRRPKVKDQVREDSVAQKIRKLGASLMSGSSHMGA